MLSFLRRRRSVARPAPCHSQLLEPRRLLAGDAPVQPTDTAEAAEVLTAPLVLEDFRPDSDGIGGDFEVDGSVQLPGGQSIEFTADAAVSVESQESTTLISVNLGPVDLDLLGLRLDLQRVALEVAITPGEGQVLGNLLSELLIDDMEAALDSVLEPLNSALGSAFASDSSLIPGLDLNDTVSDLGLSGSDLDTLVGDVSLLSGMSTLDTDRPGEVRAASSTAMPALPDEVRVLSLSIGELDLNLLGLRVQTLEPVDLSVTAQAGSGKLLGNLFVGLSSLLDPLLPTNLPSLPDTGGRSATGPSAADLAADDVVPVLGLTLSDVNLNLLGLDANLNVDLLVGLQTGQGNLLGDLLLRELQQIEQEILASGFAPLEQLLGFLFDGGVAGDAVAGEVASAASAAAPSALVTGSGGSSGMIEPVSILNLSIDELDLDLLGVLIRSEGIDAEVRAEPGPGMLLGNLLGRLLGGLQAPEPPSVEPSSSETPVLADPGGTTSTPNLPTEVEASEPASADVPAQATAVLVQRETDTESAPTDGGGASRPIVVRSLFDDEQSDLLLSV